MSRTMRAILLGLAALGLARLAFAAGAGSTGANGLKLAAGTRPDGMGSAYTGLADDLAALFWNPAGLSLIERPQATLMHATYLADTSYDVLAYAQPFGPLGTAAGAISLLNYGDIPKSGTGPSGLLSGNFSAADTFVVAGWGLALPPLLGLDRVKVGATAKGTFQQLEEATEAGLAFAAGALWEPPVAALRVGMALDNAGAVLTAGGGALPFAWRAGGSYTREIAPNWRGVVVADSLVQIDAGFRGGLGLEVSTRDLLALRGGWRGGGAEGGPTLGLGLGIPVPALNRNNRIRIDYALAAHGLLGNAHRLQLTAAIGALIPKPFGPLAVVGAAQDARLEWSGPGPAYRIEAMAEDAAAWTPLQASVSEERWPLARLRPGSYKLRVTVVNPRRPELAGESRIADFTMPAPDLLLSLNREGLDPVLRWNGGIGPAYDVYAVAPDDPTPLRINERPLTEPAFNLAGVPPGEYTFRIVTIEPGRPKWNGPVSNQTKLIVEPPPIELGLELLRTVQERLGKIQFKVNRAVVDAGASDAALDAVADVLKRFPQFRLRIEGHTDAKGGAAHNRKLSQSRAEAVVKYLIEKKGVDKSRLEAQGFGPDRPIATNETEEGRAVNRRVEFVVINAEESP